MRPLIVSALVASALALPVAAPAASSCGAVNGGFENTIRAKNVSCSAARKLVKRWHNKAVTQSQGPGSKYVGSYWCLSRATDPEHVKVSCANGSHHVSFFAGP